VHTLCELDRVHFVVIVSYVPFIVSTLACLLELWQNTCTTIHINKSPIFCSSIPNKGQIGQTTLLGHILSLQERNNPTRSTNKRTPPLESGQLMHRQGNILGMAIKNGMVRKQLVCAQDNLENNHIDQKKICSGLVTIESYYT